MNIFDKVIKGKTSPIEPTYTSSEASDIIEKERSRHERPFKAFSRGTVEGIGTLGDILSLTGYPTDIQSPGEKIKAERESQLFGPEFEKAIISEAAEPDIAPPFLGTPATSESINKFLNMLDIPKEEIRPIEKFMGRFGRFLGGFPEAPGVAATAALGGQTAEELGFGPTGQMIAEIGSSLRFNKPSLQKMSQIEKPRILTRNVEPSKAGAITERRLESLLEKANQQAGDVAKDIGKENYPFKIVSESIDRKFPIDKKFDHSFDSLEAISKKANISLKDMSPLNNFFKNELDLYKGTGAPTFMRNLVEKEIKGWTRSGKNELYPVYRRYRLNNQRIKEILTDPTFPRAFRNESIGFFSRMNKEIVSSLEASLPKDSGWMNTFRGLNNLYGAYQNTKLVRKIIDPILNKNIKDKQLNAFISSERNWEDITRFLGPEESNKLKDVLIDLQSVRTGLQSMKKLPAVWNTLMEKGVIGAIFNKTLAGLLSVPYATKWAMGHYFSSPEFSVNIKKLSAAIAEQNIPSIINSLEKIEEESKD